MAIRKAKMKEQVAEAIAQAAPGDRLIVTIATVTGASPWLMNALGLIGQFLVKFYFVTVTEQAVVFHTFNRFTQRPKELVCAIPRAQAQPLLGEVNRNPLWSSFMFALPGEQTPTRINVHRMWRNEMDELISLVIGAPYGTPVAPYAQGFPQQPGPAAPGFHHQAAPGSPQQAGPGFPQQVPAGPAAPHQPYAAPAPQPPHGSPAPQYGTPYGAPFPQQGAPYGPPAPHQPPSQPHGQPYHQPPAQPYVPPQQQPHVPAQPQPQTQQPPHPQQQQPGNPYNA
ncbi:hypothetical protein [Streptomyces sp. NPDC048639]|uniref:hypothetical protein n=1 Tax=Streptomyces sp. NPDC048639 TaxID=3365581 RepID=UPI003715745C